MKVNGPTARNNRNNYKRNKSCILGWAFTDCAFCSPFFFLPPPLLCCSSSNAVCIWFGFAACCSEQREQWNTYVPKGFGSDKSVLLYNSFFNTTSRCETRSAPVLHKEGDIRLGFLALFSWSRYWLWDRPGARGGGTGKVGKVGKVGSKILMANLFKYTPLQLFTLKPMEKVVDKGALRLWLCVFGFVSEFDILYLNPF